jgi:hypothetical protein
MQYASPRVFPQATGFSYSDRPRTFIEDELQTLARGEELVPGMPLRDICARFVRAYVNTLAGDTTIREHHAISQRELQSQELVTVRANRWGVYGNAWELPRNIVRHHGSIIYNASPAARTAANVRHWRHESAIREQARVGDIIGFYFPESLHLAEAARASAGFTHVGLVIGHMQAREPVVAHLFDTDDAMQPAPPIRHETISHIMQEWRYIPRNGDKNPRHDEPVITPIALMRPSYR